MNIQNDLDLLKRRLGFLENELAQARRQLQKLEEREWSGKAGLVPLSIEPSFTTIIAGGVTVPVPGAKPLGPTGSTLPVALPVAQRPVAEPPPLPTFLTGQPAPHRVPSAFEPLPGVASHDERDKEEPAASAGPSELRSWLERLQLWPPSGEGNVEARLGAWWATRIGTLFIVMCIVFFGIYVSQGTPPWVRFIELLAVSAGVAGLGLWLERKIEKFGAVVFAGGLALIYYCAYAGYAVKTVKIFDNVVLAAGAQLAAVALLAGAAVWRRSPLIASMGVALGFVTAWFSHAEGLHELALGAAWLLAAVAVVFHRWQRWEAPSVLALPATYAIYALVLARDWLGNLAPVPARGWVWLLLAAAGSMFFARDWRDRRVKAAEVTAGECWFQGANSTLLLLAGLVTACTLYRPQLGEFYFGAAALLGLGAWLRRRQVEGDVVGAMLLAKASGAFTLGVIEHGHGRTIALALLVQAWVMLACAQRLASRVLGWGAGLVALVACLFFVRHTLNAVDALSAAAASAVLFVAGLALFAAEAARRLVPEKNPDTRQAVEAVGATLAGTLGTLALTNWRPEAWTPTWAAALALVLTAAGAARRAWGPALAGVLVLLAGNGLLAQFALQTEPGGATLWWNALTALAPTVALGAALGGRRLAEKAGTSGVELAVAGVGAWALAVVGAVLVGFNQWSGVWPLGAAVLLALGLALAGPVLPTRRLPWLATLAAGAGVTLWLWQNAAAEPRAALVTTAAGLWLLPVGLAAWPRQAAFLQREPAVATLRVVQLALATVVTLKTGGVFFHGTELVLVFALLALGVGSLMWWPGIAAALPMSWAFWIVAGVTAVAESVGWRGTTDAPALPTLAALLVWLPAWTLTHARKLPVFGAGEATWRRVGVGVQVTLATVGAVLTGFAYYHAAGRLEILVAAVAVAALALRAGRIAAARKSATVLSGLVALTAFGSVLDHVAEGWGEGLAAVGLVAATLIAEPLVLAGGPRALTREERSRCAWVSGLAGLVLAFFALWAQRRDGVLHAYVTVGWGVAAIAVFLIGLFARLRPYRLLGLAGLALCVPRAFVVDLDSPLHRIIAFFVLGGVLLWVGFSYHRFRYLLTEQPEKAATGSASVAAIKTKPEDKT